MPDDYLMSPDEAWKLHTEAYNQGWLLMWVVFEKPKEFPNSFVSRAKVVVPAGSEQMHSRKILLAPTLEQLREMLPKGLYRELPDASDGPQVVETWF